MFLEKENEPTNEAGLTGDADEICGVAQQLIKDIDKINHFFSSINNISLQTRSMVKDSDVVVQELSRVSAEIMVVMGRVLHLLKELSISEDKTDGFSLYQKDMMDIVRGASESLSGSAGIMRASLDNQSRSGESSSKMDRKAAGEMVIK